MKHQVSLFVSKEFEWLSKHQMSLNSKRDGFDFEDFVDCAKTISVKQGTAKAILSEVQNAVSGWSKIAEERLTTR